MPISKPKNRSSGSCRTFTFLATAVLFTGLPAVAAGQTARFGGSERRTVDRPAHIVTTSVTGNALQARNPEVRHSRQFTGRRDLLDIGRRVSVTSNALQARNLDAIRAGGPFDINRTGFFDRRRPNTRHSRIVIGGSLTVIGGGRETSAVTIYSAIRPRTGTRIYNPIPVERTRPVRFTGGSLGSEDQTAGRRFNTDSLTELGASDDVLDQLIYVRTRDALPPIAISPWQEVTDANVDELIRQQPFLRSSNRDELLEDLQAGRRQWLRENGYAGGTRSFVNNRRRANMSDRERSPRNEVSGRDRSLGTESFIRIRPAGTPHSNTLGTPPATNRAPLPRGPDSAAHGPREAGDAAVEPSAVSVTEVGTETATAEDAL